MVAKPIERAAGRFPMPEAVVSHREEGPVGGLFLPVSEPNSFLQATNCVLEPPRTVERSAEGIEGEMLLLGREAPHGELGEPEWDFGVGNRVRGEREFHATLFAMLGSVVWWCLASRAETWAEQPSVANIVPGCGKNPREGSASSHFSVPSRTSMLRASSNRPFLARRSARRTKSSMDIAVASAWSILRPRSNIWSEAASSVRRLGSWFPRRKAWTKSAAALAGSERVR